MSYAPAPADCCASRNRTIFMIVMLALFFLGVAYVCAFKVMDRDFWWHVKAGEIMWRTKSLIHIDPFAYTRAGLPYLSNREWLAQVIFFLTYAFGGSTGVIVLRTLLAALSFGALLFIAPRKTVWPLAFLVFWAAHFSRPSLIERPQLFTFLCFGLFLLIALRSLRSGAHADQHYRALPAHAIGILFLLQLCWVNLHGAAAIMGIVVVSALLLQAFVHQWRLRGAGRVIRRLLWVIVGLLLISLLSPETYRFFTDLWMLTHDPALMPVKEWRPLALGTYVMTVGPFWVAALAAVAWTRRNMTFCLSLLLLVGVMSLQAYRHIILFTMTACAVTLYALAENGSFQTFLHALARRRIIAPVLTLLLLLVVGRTVYSKDIAVVQRQGLFGYGEVPVAGDAYDFLMSAGLTGNMFNSYNVGSYLLYRGHPSRPVFIDGRNVEYGFDFLNRTLLAG
ncbi:MAG: hypothetical protein PHS73_05060, partial [Candidatus Peribacteraceae bacterium]|nr:hypothetical protein [Candidatus Peribacteraceae bacterium]